MKRFVITTLALIMALSLCACSTRTENNEKAEEKPETKDSYQLYQNELDKTREQETKVPCMMVDVGGYGGVIYYRDYVTDTMFVYKDNGTDGGFTLMFNPNTGKPLTYTDYKQMYLDSLVELETVNDAQ